MHRTSLVEFKNIFRNLNLPKESIVNIHSSLLKFGIIEGGLEGLYNCLREALGPDTTITMPAFTWDFGKTGVWNYSDSKSHVGAFTEYFRKLPDTLRTIHPFHSVSVNGKLSYEFHQSISQTSFGDGSAFDKMYKYSAYNLCLGTELTGGATFLHAVEEALRVPYRFMKKFPGKVYNKDNSLIENEFSMYVRMITSEYEYDNNWDLIFNDLKNTDSFKFHSLNGAKIILCNIKDVYNLYKQFLLANPFYAVKIINKQI